MIMSTNRNEALGQNSHFFLIVDARSVIPPSCILTPYPDATSSTMVVVVEGFLNLKSWFSFPLLLLLLKLGLPMIVTFEPFLLLAKFPPPPFPPFSPPPVGYEGSFGVAGRNELPVTRWRAPKIVTCS